MLQTATKKKEKDNIRHARGYVKADCISKMHRLYLISERMDMICYTLEPGLAVDEGLLVVKQRAQGPPSFFLLGWLGPPS